MIPSLSGVLARKKWYSSLWPYRFKITVDNTKVAADLTDYPVYLNLADLGSGHSFWTYATATCVDIRITTSDGLTEVPREIVFGDTATKTGEVHFKGDLANSTDTVFYVYYGNSAAADYSTSATYGRNNVWGSNYAAVWHMQQDPSGSAPQLLDSTSNAKNGTSNGTMTSGDLVAGKLAGYAYDLDGTDDYIGIGSQVISANTWSWSGWVYTTRDGSISTGGNGIFYQGTGVLDAATRFLVGFNAGRQLTLNYEAVANKATATGVYSLNTWFHTAISYNAGSGDIYINGSSSLSFSSAGSGTPANANFNLGYWYSTIDPLRFLSGKLDECRVRGDAVASTWITTEYNNQNSSSTFYVLSAQETV